MKSSAGNNLPEEDQHNGPARAPRRYQLGALELRALIDSSLQVYGLDVTAAMRGWYAHRWDMMQRNGWRPQRREDMAAEVERTRRAIDRHGKSAVLEQIQYSIDTNCRRELDFGYLDAPKSHRMRMLCAGTGSGGDFNRFEQNSYDFDTLEELLIAN